MPDAPGREPPKWSATPAINRSGANSKEVAAVLGLTAAEMFYHAAVIDPRVGWYQAQDPLIALMLVCRHDSRTPMTWGNDEQSLLANRRTDEAASSVLSKEPR